MRGVYDPRAADALAASLGGLRAQLANSRFSVTGPERGAADPDPGPYVIVTDLGGSSFEIPIDNAECTGRELEDLVREERGIEDDIAIHLFIGGRRIARKDRLREHLKEEGPHEIEMLTARSMENKTLKDAVKKWIAGGDHRQEIFDEWGPIENWQVAQVTDMAEVFMDCEVFNGDISQWDVSGVTDMHWMFRDATAFDGNIGQWDVSGVKNMQAMFWGAETFNGDISEWDVRGVTDTSWMFYGAEAFNKDISQWVVSGVTDMRAMFARAKAFNGDISQWVVSGVTDMRAMFDDTSVQPLPVWYLRSPQIGGF